MPLYRAKYIDELGKLISVEEFFCDFQNAEKALTDRGVTLLSLKTHTYFLNIQSPSKKELEFFFHNLARLIDATIPLLKALKMLLSQSQSSRMKLFVSTLIYHVEQGKSMTESLKTMNFKIPIIVLAIIDVGLASGDLATAFHKAALFFKQENEHRQKTIEITLYPFCVLFSVICLFYFVTHTLIPQMSSYLTESGPYQKSFATSSLLMTSAIFENYGLWIAVSLGGTLGFLIIGRFLSQKLRYALSCFSLKIPFWGKLFLYHEMSQWLSTLSLLSHSGMDLQKAFQKGNEGLKNLYLKQTLEKALDDFSKGLSFCDLLEKQHLLPHLSLQLCKVGFESSEIDVMFKKSALLLKEDAEQKMSLFFKIVHPLTLILLASFILWIVCGVLLPLYNHFSMI